MICLMILATWARHPVVADFSYNSKYDPEEQEPEAPKNIVDIYQDSLGEFSEPVTFGDSNPE